MSPHFDPSDLGRPGTPIPPEDRPSLQLVEPPPGRRRIVIPVPVMLCLLAVLMVGVITVWWVSP